MKISGKLLELCIELGFPKESEPTYEVVNLFFGLFYSVNFGVTNKYPYRYVIQAMHENEIFYQAINYRDNDHANKKIIRACVDYIKSKQLKPKHEQVL